MPALEPHSGTVLITGANGYLALWAVQKHLESRYTVRATVRSASKKAWLEDEVFKSFNASDSERKLEVVVVEDMTKPGAFDEAVKGVDAIQHVASPTDVDTDDPDVYIKPAVDGTLGLLKSALVHGSSLKRVVYTSSTGAVFTPGMTAPTTFTERDWNNKSIEIVKEQGKNAPKHTWYLASKSLAEKAAWDFYEKHKKEVNWDFSVVCAPWLLGPGLKPVPHPQDLNASIKIYYETCILDTPKTADQMAAANTFIDVRDLADMYVKMLEVEEAGGERFIIAKGIASWQEWVDLMNDPSFAASLPPSSSQGQNQRSNTKGIPGTKGNYINLYDVSKAERILAPVSMFRSMEETARDMVAQWVQAGY
ncbi:hypothetical protein D9613_012747 [Agrocybe pediades]|uniref:NAD-dependent epimerase/dehydratase domain-containing protein n=1 Tax=Agrocybe pediades TaxID=84607 RepID=A0A8H4VJV4_9AGAR|nr:hypothetical protein D9613_012747 [Agrocybe pediades]